MARWTISEPTELDFDAVKVLRVRIADGSVNVVGTDETARLEITELDGPPLGVSLEDGELVVAYEDVSWPGILSWVESRRRSVTISLAVPWDCSVQLGVVTASAVVSGVHGRTSVRSVSGDLTLEGLTDTVEAETVSGNLETMSLAGDLQFSTVSGDLTVVDGSSNVLRANSVSGDVTLDVDVANGGEIELASVSGDIRIRLPHRTNVEVEIASHTGSLDSSFDGLSYERMLRARRLGGILGHGSGRLLASTVSGDIALRRREPAGVAL
jgi:Putative adhesin